MEGNWEMDSLVEGGGCYEVGSGIPGWQGMGLEKFGVN